MTVKQMEKADGRIDLEEYFKACEEEYFKACQAAAFLNISRRTFDRMKDAGQIPHIRCAGGRVLRYRKADLIEAMNALTVR